MLRARGELANDQNRDITGISAISSYKMALLSPRSTRPPTTSTATSKWRSSQNRDFTGISALFSYEMDPLSSPQGPKHLRGGDAAAAGGGGGRSEHVQARPVGHVVHGLLGRRLDVGAVKVGVGSLLGPRRFDIEGLALGKGIVLELSV